MRSYFPPRHGRNQKDKFLPTVSIKYQSQRDGIVLKGRNLYNPRRKPGVETHANKTSPNGAGESRPVGAISLSVAVAAG